MKLNEAIQERDFQITRLISYKEIAQNLGISRNRKRYKENTIEDDTLVQMKENTANILKTEKKIKELNIFIKQHRSIEDNEKDVLKNLIKELVDKKDYEKIMQEFYRRANGEHPFKVTLSQYDDTKIKNVIKEKDKINNELFELLYKARKGINLYVNNNEPEINKGQYILKVSPLTKSVPNITAIDLLKNKYDILS